MIEAKQTEIGIEIKTQCDRCGTKGSRVFVPAYVALIETQAHVLPQPNSNQHLCLCDECIKASIRNDANIKD